MGPLYAVEDNWGRGAIFQCKRPFFIGLVAGHVRGRSLKVVRVRHALAGEEGASKRVCHVTIYRPIAHCFRFSDFKIRACEAVIRLVVV